MKCIASILLSILMPGCYAQYVLNVIDLEQIPQEKVRVMVASLQQEKITRLSELESTFTWGQDMKGYCWLESAYRIKETPSTVWEIYNNTSPAESWNGRMVSFGLLISKYQNKVMYREDNYFTGIDTGQVFYVNLRIMKGLYNLAVGLEIIDIDPVNRSITFSYLKGGKSRGEQTIYFIPSRKGFTEIIHQTAFKSNSYLRDRYLYPYFHRIAINEFHRNMRNAINQGEKQLADK
ncbi:MAG TPA: hypothetical protein VJ203_03960 [Bacteroidales bacterium]|nr:hypothetical protein [Bacteroidales bacterium]